MSNLIEQLKARRAAEEAEKLASMPPTVVGEPTEEEKAAAFAAANPPPPPPPVGPPGSYRACRLQRFFKASGAKVEPNAEGFFIPADAEEAAILAHFATNGWDMVEFQDPAASAPV